MKKILSMVLSLTIMFATIPVAVLALDNTIEEKVDALITEVDALVSQISDLQTDIDVNAVKIAELTTD